MSPGTLYRYFRSKEDIIAGIAERDRAEAAQQFAAVEQGSFFDGLAGLAQHHLVERSMEEVALCAEIMAESRRNPAVARIYQDMEADVRARFIALLQRAAERGEIRRDVDFDGTVTVCSRSPTVCPGGARSSRRSTPKPSCRSCWAWWNNFSPILSRKTTIGTGLRVMKAARFAAVGLVVAAVAWIASGHLFPHETAESRAAVQPAEAAQPKPFRVSVAEVRVEPRSRKLVLSGRTEADRKMMLMARADGTITELKVRRGSSVKEGEVIAVLSDEAREARVMQARAMLMQRKTELAAKMKLVEQGTMPKLEAVNLETQFKAAEAGLAAAEAEKRAQRHPRAVGGRS